MKEIFESVELEIILFQSNDVITTSAGGYIDMPLDPL